MDLGLGRRATLGALLAAVLPAGCGPLPTPEQQAIRVAYDEARSRFHYAQDLRTLPPRVTDRGDYWRVYFQGPPCCTGGDVIVEVRKSDLAILEAAAGQ